MEDHRDRPGGHFNDYRLGPVMTWQPIETAPLGTKVLVWAVVPGYMHKHVVLARFWKQHTLEVAEGYEEEDWAEIDEDGSAYMPADWYEEGFSEDGSLSMVNIKPTHWMPMPSPPTDEKA